jgi:hypothetical protein
MRLPNAVEGVKLHAPGLVPPFVNEPFPYPEVITQETEPYVPVALAPAREMALVPVQTNISVPASAVGSATQEIERVTVGSVPRQPAEPIASKVAVNDPEPVEGVNVHCVGSVVLVLLHEPCPAPPVQLRLE